MIFNVIVEANIYYTDVCDSSEYTQRECFIFIFYGLNTSQDHRGAGDIPSSHWAMVSYTLDS